MPRIRSVHPGLFTDEAFASLTESAQVFLIGIWTEADDQGVFEWKPTTLRMRLRPTKDGDVDRLLAELSAANSIKSYELDGRKYGLVRNFRKFQRPKKPNSVFVMPAEYRTYVGLSPSSTEPPPDKPTSVPQKGEKSPQMEDGGGRKEDEERKQDAAASAAPDPVLRADDHEGQLFRRGKEILGTNAGGLINKLLQAKNKNVALARAALEVASTKETPREYIGGVVNGGADHDAKEELRRRGDAW